MSMPEPPHDNVPTEDPTDDANAAPAAAAMPGEPSGSPGRRIALVAGVIVLAVAMAWFAIGQGSDRNDPPVTLAGDGVTLTLPAGWNGTTDLSVLPEVDGLTPPQEDTLREWMESVAADDRVHLLAIDGFDSVVVLSVDGMGDAPLRDVVDAYIKDGATNGFELVERAETTVDGVPAVSVASVNSETGEETYDVIWMEGGSVWVATWSTEIDRIAEIRADIDATMASLSTS